MTTYKPRRAAVGLLDGDCPAGVLAIFDNPDFADRYTVFYCEIYGGEGRQGYMWGRGMSANPSHPQGCGMSLEMRPYEVTAYRDSNKSFAANWSGLPQAVKDCVNRDLTEG